MSLSEKNYKEQAGFFQPALFWGLNTHHFYQTAVIILFLFQERIIFAPNSIKFRDNYKPKLKNKAMKKFLLLFSAVLFGFANAFAQEEWADPQSHDDVVTDISQLSNNKVYSIIPEDWYHPTQDGEYLRPNGLYGVLFARSTGDRLESAGGWGNCIDNQDPRKEPYAGWQTQAKAIQKDSYDPQQQFAIINYEGKYYLWAVAAKKFAAVHDMSALGYSNWYADLSTAKVSPVELRRCADVDKYDNRFLIFFKDDKNVGHKMNFSVAWHSNAVFMTECLLQPDENENDLSAFEICGRGEFDPTEAIEVLDNIFHPAATIVYTVKDGDGNVISVSDPIPVSTGVTIDDLPDNMKEDFYQYTCEESIVTVKGENFVTLVKGERVYPVEYSEYLSPVTDDAVAEGKFYYMTLNGEFLYLEDGTLKSSPTLENSDEYQWMFFAADDQAASYGDGCFRIFNKSLGAEQCLYYQGANMRMRPYNASNPQALAMTPWGKPYGKGFALSKISDKDYYVQISEEVEGAFQFTKGEGEEFKRQYPTDKHGIRVYEAGDEPQSVAIQFNVREQGGGTLASQTVEYPLGTEITDLPDELIRDFTDYEYPDPFVALPEGDNVFTALATFNMPFEEATPYRITLDGKYLKADKENGIAFIDQEADIDDTFDPVYFWSFRGNPYGGIEIMNRGTGTALANNLEATDNIPVPMGDAEWWNVFDNGAGMVFGKSDKFIANIDGALVLTPLEDPMWEEPSGFVLEDVETASVDFIVKDNDGNEVITKTEDGHYVGVAVDDIPESIKRPFCEYQTEPVMVESEGTVVNSVVTYTTPFTTDGANFYLKVDGATVGFVNNALLAKATPTDEDLKDESFFWNFEGTPYEGYSVKNVKTGKYLSGNTRVKARVEMGDSPVKFAIKGSGENFTFNGVNNELISREGNVLYLAVEPTTEASTAIQVEKVPEFVNVTFVVKDVNGAQVFTAEEKVIAGTVITELPAEMKREFCTYSENSITVDASAENVYEVTVSYNLPFETSAIADGVENLYTIKVEDGQVLQSYFDDYDSEYYVQVGEAEAGNAAQLWAFEGNPYEGFVLYNKDRGQYVVGENRNDYCAFGAEGTRWTLGGTADAMTLFNANGGFYYLDSYMLFLVDADATPFSVELAPQKAAVVYSIVDADNVEVYTETVEDVQIGTVISELPATAVRDFCSYEFDPITVGAGENKLEAKVTYNLPFNTENYNYITVGDTAAVYGFYSSSDNIGKSGFDDVRPASGTDFDIKDITTWFKWPYTLEQQGMIHDMYGDKFDSQYGSSMALNGDYLWQIIGNPYSGFALILYYTDDDANPLYLTENDGSGVATETLWELSAVDGGYAFKRGDVYLSAYHFVSEGTAYGFIGSDSEPTAFNFVEVDTEAYEKLLEDYMTAQEELSDYITGIKTVKTDANEGKQIFDLQGRRLGSLQKGVNIVNGKKVLVK